MIYYASFRLKRDFAALAQSVEHFLGKEEVDGPIPLGGSSLKWGGNKKTNNNSQEY